MSEQLQFDPATMDPRAVYRLLIGSVVPRPIGWASTATSQDRVACAVPPSRVIQSPWETDGQISVAKLSPPENLAPLISLNNWP
jgi:hypothetical protein